MILETSCHGITPAVMPSYCQGSKVGGQWPLPNILSPYLQCPCSHHTYLKTEPAYGLKYTSGKMFARILLVASKLPNSVHRQKVHSCTYIYFPRFFFPLASFVPFSVTLVPVLSAGLLSLRRLENGKPSVNYWSLSVDATFYQCSLKEHPDTYTLNNVYILYFLNCSLKTGTTLTLV